MSVRARRGFALAGLLLFYACAQTDVIARERSVACEAGARCTDAGPGDAGAFVACRAAPCADFSALQARCADPASHVSLGDGCSEDDPMRAAFRFGVCSCTDFVSEQPLVVESWNAQAKDAGVGVAASVAVNGAFAARGTLVLAGSLVVGGAATLGAPAAQTFSGTLHEHASPACVCGAANLLDIDALVQAGATDNDDAALGFDAEQLAGFTRPKQAPALELGCGRYYVAGLHGAGALTLRVTGHVVLLVAGDLAVDDDFVVELAAGAALDLFVGGNVRAGARFVLGDAASAPNARLYVGGLGTVDIAGEAFVGGLLYAPRAELVTRAGLTVYGSLFVRRAAPLGAVTVHQDLDRGESADCALETAH